MKPSDSKFIFDVYSDDKRFSYNILNDDSDGSLDTGIEPDEAFATKCLPMINAMHSMDMMGNNGMQPVEASETNPATGLPMIDGMCSVDVMGNVIGHKRGTGGRITAQVLKATLANGSTDMLSQD